ncbi:MAG: hypothetical protein K2J55_04315 [Eubacterium sp.]|nr:hypothetical protein [Eubacterium sp.]
MIICLLGGCKPEKRIESKVRFSSGNQSDILKDNIISGEDAANIIKSYSKNELMLYKVKEYSLFVSSETAVYDNENYYKVVAGKAVLNELNYYSIEEFGCYLVSRNGEKVFVYDKENGSVIPLNIMRDIVA